MYGMIRYTVCVVGYHITPTGIFFRITAGHAPYFILATLCVFKEACTCMYVCVGSFSLGVVPAAVSSCEPCNDCISLFCHVDLTALVQWTKDPRTLQHRLFSLFLSVHFLFFTCPLALLNALIHCLVYYTNVVRVRLRWITTVNISTIVIWIYIYVYNNTHTHWSKHDPVQTSWRI